MQMSTFSSSAAAPAAGGGDAGAGIPGSGLAGPFPVGEYARALRGRLRSFARVQLVGELVNLRPSRARVYFELRDPTGSIPCAIWLKDWEVICAHAAGTPADGMQVVVSGGCDYYPGSATSSPGFSFAVADLRVAGEGDLLARIERLRRQLAAEGLLELQKRLALPPLPRTIGVITGEGGKARDDILAGLHRRGWAGRLVWGFAPVQDRHAAPMIVRALGDLAAVGGVEVAIVARGGGSLADLLCFCDETLCRTVALLGVPVISSVGHHTDRTLLDDVAAVSCSTPTHAAEAAVGVDCSRARADQVAAASQLRKHGRRAVLSRAKLLASLSRAPAAHLERQRTRLHQQLREMRAGARRRAQS
jgi:exodeoxyribonuclease VII large subunit